MTATHLKDVENNPFIIAITVEKGKYNVSKPEYNLLPVVAISWYGAKAYCDWLGNKDDGYKYRLPTADEYEKAAKGCLLSKE